MKGFTMTDFFFWNKLTDTKLKIKSYIQAIILTDKGFLFLDYLPKTKLPLLLFLETGYYTNIILS